MFHRRRHDEIHDVPSAKKPKRLPLILGSIAGVLIVALIAGSLTNWFGFYGPATKIIKAGMDTLRAKNMTVVCTYNGEELATVHLVMDTEKRDLSVAVYDKDDQVMFSIYGGYFMYTYHFKDHAFSIAIDISDRLNTFFNRSEQATGDMDLEALLSFLDRISDGWLSDTFDMDKLDNSVIKYYRKMNSKLWLKKYAGFSEEKKNGMTVYRFEPDMEPFLDQSLACFEPAFKSEEGYQGVENELKNITENIQYLTLGLQDGYLVSAEIGLEDSKQLHLQLLDIGSTTVDTDELARLLDRAQKF